MRLLPIALFMIFLIVMLPIVHANTLSLTYDANGNLVTGDGLYREYNSLNQLVRVYNGSDTSGLLMEEFIHDPVEERILMKKVYNNDSSLKETVIYVNERNVRVINDSGTFDFGYVKHEGQLVAQVNPDGSKYFIHSDHLGSTTVVTDEAGDVIENTSYTPFGEIISGGEVSRFDYEGKEHDSVVGDTDFHFRKYKADWALFTQPDSLLPNVFDPQQLNRYAFERGNPFRYVDEDGHFIGQLIYYGYLALTWLITSYIPSIPTKVAQKIGTYLGSRPEIVTEDRDITNQGTYIPPQARTYTEDEKKNPSDEFKEEVVKKTLEQRQSVNNVANTQANSQSSSNGVRSITSISSGNNIKWYYNPKTGQSQWWYGEGRPPNSDFETVPDSQKSTSKSSSRSSSTSDESSSKSSSRRYSRCRAFGNAKCGT